MKDFMPKTFFLSIYVTLTLTGFMVSSTLAHANPYQIGPEWGKTAITKFNFSLLSPPLQKASILTANVNGATGFYIGRFNGAHVIATNHHVCPMGFHCLGKKITFPTLKYLERNSENHEATLKKWIGTFAEIDLTLMEIEITDPRLESILEINAENFHFKASIQKGQTLASLGFGRQNNPERRMSVAQDEDCKVYSEDNDFRKIADPDTRNPGTYQAWSFAIGCDGSHGDSGSPILDRQTGKLLGILWTGRVPKDPRVLLRDFLDALIRAPSAETWTELTYAVPAPKIYSVLGENLNSPKLSPEAKVVLQTILNTQN